MPDLPIEETLKTLNVYAGILAGILALLAFLGIKHFTDLWKRRAPEANPKNEREILLRLVKNRYDQWNQDSFTSQVPIVLSYTAAEDAVSPYYLARYHRENKHPIPQGATIADLYRDSQGQFLLLGAPGTGKSNELHALLNILWKRAHEDFLKHPDNPAEPVPVLLNLTSWAIGQHKTLEDWVAKELETSYQIGAHRSQDWARQVVLLLDGLDEVREDVRADCLQAIIRLAQPHVAEGRQSPLRRLVLSSRRKDFEHLKRPVGMPAAEVAEIDGEHLRDILKEPDLEPIRQALSREEDMAPERSMRAVLNTPLMLALLYEGAAAPPSTLSDPKHRIYDRFLTATLSQLESTDGYKAEDSRRWLGWLAEKLEGANRARFDLEDLGPAWLPDLRARRWAGLSFRLGFGLLVGLGVWLVDTPDLGLLLGLISGLVFGIEDRTAPAETLTVTTQSLRRGLGGALAAGLEIGLLVGLVVGVVVALLVGMVGGLVGGLAAGLVGALAAGLVGALAAGLVGALAAGLVGGIEIALETASVSERTAPAEGVRRSLRYASRFAAGGVLLALAALPLLPLAAPALEPYGVTGRDAAGMLSGLPPLLAALGLFLGFSKGGSFALRHYVTRLLLWRRGLAPWRYVRFLTRAAQKGVLKPVGGGFQFRHRELRAFIATHYAPSQRFENI